MVKLAHFSLSGDSATGYSVPSKQRKQEKLPDVTNRSSHCLKFHFSCSPTVALDLSSFKGITWSHWTLNFSTAAGNVHTAWTMETKTKPHSCSKASGNCPQTTEETLQVNSKHVIFENRVKSNKPSVNIIFLISDLLHVCTRRMITAISSGP